MLILALGRGRWAVSQRHIIDPKFPGGESLSEHTWYDGGILAPKPNAGKSLSL